MRHTMRAIPILLAIGALPVLAGPVKESRCLCA
jgi:hypothetical protein